VIFRDLTTRRKTDTPSAHAITQSATEPFSVSAITAYRDLGSDYFTRRIDQPEARKRRLIHELQALGQKVTIEPAA
jgi:hypothetical protein